MSAKKLRLATSSYEKDQQRWQPLLEELGSTAAEAVTIDKINAFVIDLHSAGGRLVPISSAARQAILRPHEVSKGPRFVCPDRSNQDETDGGTWFARLQTGCVGNFSWHDLQHTLA